MAWTCSKCERRIFEPRVAAIRYVFQWKYIKRHEDLTVDLKNLNEVNGDAVITHLHCPAPEVPGFKARMKALLKMPPQRDHPLLFGLEEE